MDFNLSSPKRIFFCSGLATLCAFVFGFILSLLFRAVSSDLSDHSLEFVIAVCRHGTRSPIFFYPTDPYNDTLYWPEGMGGALTNKGKMQMYNLGHNFRNHYYKLFENRYRVEDIYVRSTKVPRTYMSVAILLAGMFPPKGNDVWNQDLNWQPIPIWPDSFDKTEIVTNNSICTKFSEEQQGVLLESQWYLKENKELFDYISIHSGYNIERLDELIYVWDPISCERASGLTLPFWTKSVLTEKLTAAATHMFKLMVSGTKEMNRLLSGPLIKDFNSWIKRKMTGEVSEKMLLHSGHDFTIIGLLSAVGFTDIREVKPSASLMIEFYSSSEGEIVKMFYANDSTVLIPMQLNMPNCRDPCSLVDFLEMTKQFETKDDWQSECNM